MRALPVLAAVTAVLVLPAAAAAEVPVNHSPPSLDINLPSAVEVGRTPVVQPRVVERDAAARDLGRDPVAGLRYGGSGLRASGT